MPAVALELGDLAAFLFLLLIAAALWVLIGLLNNSLGRLPVVGSWITQNISAALNDARNAVLSGASATWGAGVKLFDWVSAVVTNISNGLFNAFVQVVLFDQRLVDVTIPAVESRVTSAAFSWFTSAESYALSLWNQASSAVGSAVASALVTVSGWVTAARNDAAAAIATLDTALINGLRTAETDAANAVTAASSTLTADIAAAEAFAAAQVASLAGTVTADVAALAAELGTGIANAETIAKATAVSLVGGVYTDLTTWADQAVADAWPDAAGELGQLRQTLGADFPWLSDLLGALGGLGVAGLAGALIRSMATSQAVTRLANDCVVPQCRGLGGLSHDLTDLLGTASTAAMLAWLIFGVTDPAGWSSELVTVAGPIASGTAHAAANLFGGH